MSQLEVDKIIPQSGTTLTIGDSGDTITITSGATLNASLNADNLDSGTVPDGRLSGSYTNITGLTVETTADNGVTIEAHDNLTTTYPLKVQNLAGSGRLEIGTYGINNNIDLKFQTQDTLRMRIDDSLGDVDFYEDTGTTPKMRWDASTERLGIGTTSPVTPLQVNRDISGVTDALSLRANSNVINEYIGLNFAKATWGKMSGIYGKNENSGNADGRLGFYTSSGGSYAERLGITSSGLIFPGSDNTQDLGSSGSRFNDLYLGGGVYLGGTGTANKLDDYEEGLHEASLTTSSSGTVNLGGNENTLSYVKIGHLVNVQGQLSVNTLSSPVGYIKISMPFTAASLTKNSDNSACSLLINNVNTATVGDFVGIVQNGTSELRIYLGDTTYANEDSAQELRSGTSIYLNVSYRTT